MDFTCSTLVFLHMYCKQFTSKVNCVGQ